MSQFNKDELEAPAWLDQSFFEEVMRTFKGDQDVSVKDFQITPGTAAGDHFASIMFKITVNFRSPRTSSETTNEIKLIMKLMPQAEGFKKEMLKETPAFRNEIRMYEEVLPAMEKVLAGGGINVVFGPPLVYTNLDKYPSPVIVFQDISPDGFVSPMWGALPFDKTKIALTTIAKFHAASLYLNENGIKLTDFDEHIFKPKTAEHFNPVEQFFKPAFLNGISNIKGWDGCKEIGEKLERNLDQYLELMSGVYDSAKTANYSVLNHGDFHAKNLMYRNAGVTQEDFLLIDYQFPIWGTPAIDVYYLLNLIADTDTREAHRDDLIILYHQVFAEVLRKIGYKGKIPSLLDLRIEMLHYSVVDLTHMIGSVGLQFLDLSKLDFNAFMENPGQAMIEMNKMVYESEAYKEYLIMNLKRLEAQGTLG